MSSDSSISSTPVDTSSEPAEVDTPKPDEGIEPVEANITSEGTKIDLEDKKSDESDIAVVSNETEPVYQQPSQLSHIPSGSTIFGPNDIIYNNCVNLH